MKASLCPLAGWMVAYGKLERGGVLLYGWWRRLQARTREGRLEESAVGLWEVNLAAPHGASESGSEWPTFTNEPLRCHMGEYSILLCPSRRIAQSSPTSMKRQDKEKDVCLSFVAQGKWQRAYLTSPLPSFLPHKIWIAGIYHAGPEVCDARTFNSSYSSLQGWTEFRIGLSVCLSVYQLINHFVLLSFFLSL